MINKKTKQGDVNMVGKIALARRRILAVMGEKKRLVKLVLKRKRQRIIQDKLFNAALNDYTFKRMGKFSKYKQLMKKAKYKQFMSRTRRRK